MSTQREPAEPTSAVYRDGYFATRLAPTPRRGEVWRHICQYLQQWIPSGSSVLELGAGWCDFSNHVSARRVVALDLDHTAITAAAGNVEAIIGDCADLSRFSEGEFDVVFASNLLEHLDRSTADSTLAESARVLTPGGRLILMQPNFRLKPGAYLDDFTHVSIYTDRSLPDYLVSRGWHVDAVRGRFLPLTMKSKASAFTFLVPWYLRSPVKPFAGQMLVVASRP
jgi:ubiquinone/menaquinone biosynthesis C-methylase UbiE